MHSKKECTKTFGTPPYLPCILPKIKIIIRRKKVHSHSNWVLGAESSLETFTFGFMSLESSV